MARLLSYVHISLTITICEFCPDSVSMCFVWISEQTAFVSLHNINWFIVLLKRQSVYF